MPAIVAPFTFLGNQDVNNFAIFINYWLGTVIGGIAAIVTTIMFFIAFITFDQVGDLKNQNIVAEIAGYIFLTFGLWNIG